MNRSSLLYFLKLLYHIVSVRLRSLTLRNYRSYAAENFAFHGKVNVIYGDNAQGKTNLLEAIHFLMLYRPFKQVKLEEIISFGEGDCRIKGEIESESGLDEVHVTLSGDRKTVKLNGKIVYRISRIFGRYHVVSFLPSDIELVKGSPQGRRRYLDSLICTIEPAHMRDLKQYQRSLLQRNAILSKEPRLTTESLEIWDEKLAEAGSRVVSRRLRYIDKIVPHMTRIYELTSGIKSEVGIKYTASFKSLDKPEQGLLAELRERFDKDRKRGHTTAGPHRDNVGFTIGDRDASVYASQGEAKNLALALKASEIDLVKDELGKTPVLLLDDVTSELDERRKKFLFRLLDNFNGQIFITTTSLKEIQYKGEMKVFHIRAGKAEQKQVSV